MPVLNKWHATPPLVQLFGMPPVFYSTTDAVRRFEVSERTLRRRIAAGVEGSKRDADGAWLLPGEWLSQFGLRDPGMPPEPSGMPQGMRVLTSPMPRKEKLAPTPAPVVAASKAAVSRVQTVVGMPTETTGTPVAGQVAGQIVEKDARIDQLRDQITDLRVEMAGSNVELKYSEAAVVRITAERDRATSDLEQSRSELERMRVDLTASEASRTAEADAAETLVTDKAAEVERQLAVVGELRASLRTAEDQAKRKYRRARRKAAKKAAKAKR